VLAPRSLSADFLEERTNMKRTNAVVAILSSLFFMGCVPQRALAAGATVTVDYSQPKQTIAGFGASITWLAGDINGFAPADQTAVLDALYSTTKPSAGLSIIRAGSMLCEFNPSAGTYNWNNPLIQSEISWMNRVKSTYGVNQFLVTTWTPPAFMKSNNSCSNGGSVLTQYYPDLANTMVLWMQNAQTSLGQQVNVWSVQNEPSNSTSYDSANYTPAQFISFVTGYLKPAMLSAGLTTKIAVPEPSVWGGPSYFDSNWGFPILQNQPQMDADVDILATHDYGANASLASPSLAALQYNKPIWQTEVYKGRTYNGSISDALSWADSIHGALSTGNFNAWFYWWSIDPYNDNQALISYNNSTWIYTIPKRVYAIGNFSRFMRPGSIVLATSSTSSSVQATAVSPTSGTVALALANQSKSSVAVTVNLSNFANPPSIVTPYRTSATENQVPLSTIPVTGGSFTVTLPASSIVTLIG
jgi:glucuronoarabinoxylan endo-1,4-beta-xylanase